MSVVLNTSKTVAILGQKDIKNLNKNKLKAVILALIDKGYDTYIVGTSAGFDLEALRILKSIKQNTPIKIVACAAYAGQDKYYADDVREDYLELLKCANEKHTLAEKYDCYAVHRRDCYMLDKSAVMLTYVTTNYGSSASAIKYAERKKKYVVNLK